MALSGVESSEGVREGGGDVLPDSSVDFSLAVGEGYSAVFVLVHENAERCGNSFAQWDHTMGR